MSTKSNFKNFMHPNKNLPPSQSTPQKRKPSSMKSKKYLPNFPHPQLTILKTFSQNQKLNPSFIPAQERPFSTILKESQKSQTFPIPQSTIK
jgi:hypothetical protein